MREQIQDTAFNFFSWTDGEFEFAAEDTSRTRTSSSR